MEKWVSPFDRVVSYRVDTENSRVYVLVASGRDDFSLIRFFSTMGGSWMTSVDADGIDMEEMMHELLNNTF